MKICLFFLCAILLYNEIAFGKVYSTRDEALAKVFAGAESVEKKTLYLSEEDRIKVSAISGPEITSRLFTYYEAKKDGAITGYAVFASHVVRTKQAVTMAVVNPDLSLRFVEVVAFYEPTEYLPARGWFEQFKGKRLSERLWPRRDIHAVSGATMSVNTITAEVRKVLALFEFAVERRGEQ